MVLIGSIPPSTKVIGVNNSIIERLTDNRNIAKTIKLDNLKITKLSFKNAIELEVRSGYLLKD